MKEIVIPGLMGFNQIRSAFVGSPYSADSDEKRKEYDDYLKDCVLFCIRRHIAPFAPHGFFTKFLNDKDPDERANGINCGIRIGEKLDAAIFFIDYGISKGMADEIKRSISINQTVIFWSIRS